MSYAAPCASHTDAPGFLILTPCFLSMRRSKKSHAAHVLTLTYSENNDTARATRNEQEGTDEMWLQEAHGGGIEARPRQEGTCRDGMQMHTEAHRWSLDSTIDGQSHRGCDQ